MTARPGQIPLNLRIVGGCAGLFIESCPWIGSVAGASVLEQRFTITFVSDGRTVSLRDRRISDAELLKLGDFLRGLVSDDLPHITVPRFEMASGVLAVSVIAGAEHLLTLEFNARSYFDEGETDSDGVAFSLPRSALWEALTAIDKRLGLASNLPDDLSGLEG